MAKIRKEQLTAETGPGDLESDASGNVIVGAIKWTDNTIDLSPANTRGISLEDTESFEVGLLLVDQSQTSGPSRLTALDDYQTLTHGVGGLWIKFDLLFHTTTTEAVRIKAFSGSGTGGPLIASFAPAIYSAGWHTFTFPSPPAVTAGSVATIQFQTTGTSAVNLAYATGNPYPGGALASPANSDVAFRTYVKDVLADYNATGVYVLGDLNLGADNASATSVLKQWNPSPGQITELELNEGATKIQVYSDDSDFSGNSSVTLKTEKAIKAYVEGHSTNGVWDRTGTTVTLKNPGDDLDLSNHGNTYLSSTATQTLVAADTLISSEDVIYVQGSGGPVTLTSNPQIAAPTNPTACMNLRIIGTSNTNTLTFVNGNGIVLHSGSSITLGQSDILVLIWDEVNNIYVQQDVAGTSAVTSVFGRTGAVVAALNDYDASEVNNDSVVAGETVKDALNTLASSSAGPLFIAELSTTQSNVTGDGSGFNPIFDTEVVDTGSDYNNTTGVFTAPSTDYYLFNLILHLDGLTTSHTGGYVLFSASVHPKRILELNFGAIRSLASARDRFTLTWISKMDLGETANISFNVTGGTKVVSLLSTSPDRIPQWSGYKINSAGVSQTLADLKGVYYVNKAGSDSDTGLNSNESLLTITQALTNIAALTGPDAPSASNPVSVVVLGGGTYIEDITSLAYVNIIALEATIVGNYTAVDNSFLMVKELKPKTTSPFLSVTKSAGSGSATVQVTEALNLGVNHGVSCTSGTLNMITNNVYGTSGTPIPSGSSGTINWTIAGECILGVADFAAYNTAGYLNLKANKIENGAASLFNFSSGLCYIHLDTNYMKSADRCFAIGSGPVVHLRNTYWEEVNASTISGNFQYETQRYHRSGDTYNDYARFRQDIFGKYWEFPGSTKGIFDGDIDLKNGTVEVNNGTLKVASNSIFEVADTRYGSHKQTFVNLSTTPVTITHTFAKNRVYQVILENVDGKQTIFPLYIGYNASVPELITALPNGVSVYTAPMSNISYTNLGLDDLYQVGFTGVGTHLFDLTITRSSGAAILAATAATTGTTTLWLIPVTGI